MFRLCLFTLIFSTLPVFAQAPEARFRFVAGAEFTYDVQQETTVIDTAFDEQVLTTAMTATKLNLRKVWTIKSISPEGVATWELRLISLKHIINRPGPKDKDGKPTVDSIVVDSATDEGKAALAETLNKPVLTLNMNDRGELSNIVSVNPANAERLQQELPFRILWPNQPKDAENAWLRTFTMKSPLGTGEKYELEQTFTPKGAREGFKVYGVSTAIKNPPKDEAELPPLIPILWSGEIYWDGTNGVYSGARLEVVKELKDHQGKGTEFKYTSKYQEGRVK